jgi:N-acyl homoserine lactone hydrolase
MMRERAMRRWKSALLALGLLLSPPALARAPEVTLWRLDCGLFVKSGESNGCYLIRHNGHYMLFDAGLDADLAGRPPQVLRGKHLVTLKTTLVDQLKLLGLKSADIEIVAISHYHFDHTGQATSFPQARLMIGKDDWDEVTTRHPDADLTNRIKPWIDGAPKTLVTGDADIYGDGTVVMLDTPGHTPGHHSLLVKLKHMGNVLITGDLYDDPQQMRERTIQSNAANPDAVRKSYDRFEGLVAKYHATIIMGHYAPDIAKLPPFPKAAN